MPEHITLVVHKELVIERRHEDTFRLFTESFGAWWPVATHSINEDKVLEAILDGREDGRIYERTVDGTECDWGIISDWDPPNGFTVSWKPNLDPEGHRTTWTIHFEADGEATRITLNHTGWEGFGDDAEKARDMYDGGWDVVMRAYSAQSALSQSTQDS